VLVLSQGDQAPFNTDGPYVNTCYFHALNQFSDISNPLNYSVIQVLKDGTYRIDWITWGQQSSQFTMYVNGLATDQKFSVGNNRQLIGELKYVLHANDLVTIVKSDTGQCQFSDNINVFGIVFTRISGQTTYS